MSRAGRYCHYCKSFLGGNPKHDCSAFRREAQLPLMTVQVIPPRSAEDLAESLRRYRRSLRCKQ